jgi:hypothetical protein
LAESEPLRNAIWKNIGLPIDLEFPKLNSELLYPKLSSTVHKLGMKKVIMQSDLDPLIIKFYEQLAILYKTKVVLIDADLIALAKTDAEENEISANNNNNGK